MSGIDQAPGPPPLAATGSPELKEIVELPAASVSQPDGLPEIPGGWTNQSVTLGGRTIELTQPARPDAFLDDPAVEAQHALTGYMPYWAYLWPASYRMAAAVANPPWEVGSHILELGAGVGLVGLASLVRGDRVTFSDYERLAVDLTLFNAKQNGFQAEGLVLDWCHPPEQQFDVIIGCELIYEDRNHEPLLGLLQTMLSPHGICWLGDAGRTKAERFYTLVPQYGFNLVLKDENGQQLHEPRFGKYQLFELTHHLLGQ